MVWVKTESFTVAVAVYSPLGISDVSMAVSQYPDWVLNVPFGVDLNQHLVLGGQHLSSIAAKVYNDVTQWHKIYEANKGQILHPNLIFPAQVLDIPAN